MTSAVQPFVVRLSVRASRLGGRSALPRAATTALSCPCAGTQGITLLSTMTKPGGTRLSASCVRSGPRGKSKTATTRPSRAPIPPPATSVRLLNANLATTPRCAPFNYSWMAHQYPDPTSSNSHGQTVAKCIRIWPSISGAAVGSRRIRLILVLRRRGIRATWPLVAHNCPREGRPCRGDAQPSAFASIYTQGTFLRSTSARAHWPWRRRRERAARCPGSPGRR